MNWRDDYIRRAFTAGPLLLGLCGMSIGYYRLPDFAVYAWALVVLGVVLASMRYVVPPLEEGAATYARRHCAEIKSDTD